MTGLTQLRLTAVPGRTTVASHPVATMLSLLADGVGVRPQGLPPRWRTALRSALPADTRVVVTPMFHPASASFPDCLAATGEGFGRPPEEQIQVIADTAPGLLIEQLEADYRGAVPSQWRSVTDDPKRWLDRYVAVLRTLWGHFAPVWRRASALFDREAERIGSAVVRETLSVVLAGLSPRFRYADQVLYVPDGQPAVYRQAERPLTLVPLFSGVDASVFNFESPDRVWIGYPPPGLGRLWTDAPLRPQPGDPLVLLLGTARTAILRTLAQPASMGSVAGAAGCSRATATYHCGQLEAAGLVARQRSGNRVRVYRTARGDALVDLLS